MTLKELSDKINADYSGSRTYLENDYVVITSCTVFTTAEEMEVSRFNKTWKELVTIENPVINSNARDGNLYNHCTHSPLRKLIDDNEFVIYPIDDYRFHIKK